MTIQAPQHAHPKDPGNGDFAYEQEIRELFEHLTFLSAALVGPQHLIETANPAFLGAFGVDQAYTGIPVADLVPVFDELGVLALLDQVLQAGEPHGHDISVDVDNGVHAHRTFKISLEPCRDDTGQVCGVLLTGVDTTGLRRAQRLMNAHRALIEQITRQAPLAQMLDGMARTIEESAPNDVLVSVLLADPDGHHLHHGAAPSLPEFFTTAIDGIPIREGVGSCGTAAHRREPVIVTDISTDPLWNDLRDVAQRAGLRACWSTPIIAGDATLLGTFAMYHRTPRSPQATDRALAQTFTDIASLIVERHHSELARAAAVTHAETVREHLTTALNAEHQLRAEAAQRSEAAAHLAAQMRSATAAQGPAPHPERCELGGAQGCDAPADLKIADSWGDAAWGCPHHVEEALLNVRSVFIADEELGGLAAYLNR